jgi:hypothetical protein
MFWENARVLGWKCDELKKTNMTGKEVMWA